LFITVCDIMSSACSLLTFCTNLHYLLYIVTLFCATHTECFMCSYTHVRGRRPISQYTFGLSCMPQTLNLNFLIQWHESPDRRVWYSLTVQLGGPVRPFRNFLYSTYGGIEPRAGLRSSQTVLSLLWESQTLIWFRFVPIMCPLL